MWARWSLLVMSAALVMASGCAATGSESAPPPVTDLISPTEPPAPTTTTTAAPTTTTGSSATTTAATTTTTVAQSTTSTTPASTTSTTVAPTTTTTVPAGVPGVYDPVCVVKVKRGDTIERIALRLDSESPDPEGLRIENGILFDEPERGTLLDTCTTNGIDDITGEARADPAEATRQLAVIRQQEKLNELFDGYGIRELLVDGVSGPVTRQRLCAFRLSQGLPVTLTDMEAGSKEEKALMKARELKIPFNEAVLATRWVLIDKTCQIMFAGEGTDRLVFVFPTSTGTAEHETRPQNRSRAFRYDPAVDNGGWHNSSTYPAEADNPLNGNMYKPIYFDNGQAIHGANSVPTSPASHGCARLRVENQDMLVAWLGLPTTGATNSSSLIDLAVTVQGAYG